MDNSILKTGTPALTFSFSTQTMRVIMRGDEPWFVASDVCDALAIGNVSLAVNGRPDRADSGLDDDERGIANVNTPSGDQQMLIINESGLYSLILTSRKPEAKKFKKWVTSEVLPAIRKTGRYEAPQAAPAPVPPDTAAVEYLTPNDAANVRNVIHWIAKTFRHERCWSNAMWFDLRQVLQWPSPQPFTVEQLPRIAQELGRINNIVYQVQEIIRDIEAQAIRRILRKGEDAEMVLVHLRKQAEKDMAEVTEFYSKLPAYMTNDLNAITMRKPHHGYLKSNTQEQLDFFKA